MSAKNSKPKSKVSNQSSILDAHLTKYLQITQQDIIKLIDKKYLRDKVEAVIETFIDDKSEEIEKQLERLVKERLDIIFKDKTFIAFIDKEIKAHIEHRIKHNGELDDNDEIITALHTFLEDTVYTKLGIKRENKKGRKR